ncbi:hypothetical protein Lal_00041578 [Lupinus albus]|nr:hypothetical protein Lal_00041578 [Lupinus albus]
MAREAPPPRPSAPQVTPPRPLLTPKILKYCLVDGASMMMYLDSNGVLRARVRGAVGETGQKLESQTLAYGEKISISTDRSQLNNNDLEAERRVVVAQECMLYNWYEYVKIKVELDGIRKKHPDDDLSWIPVGGLMDEDWLFFEKVDGSVVELPFPDIGRADRDLHHCDVAINPEVDFS